jgi:hypothetical protein
MRAHGIGTTPARNSLHEAGWAVDVDLPKDPKQRAAVNEAAAAAGLRWGGAFRKPDPVHYYVDPDPRHRSALIDSFTGRVKGLQSGGPTPAGNSRAVQP